MKKQKIVILTLLVIMFVSLSIYLYKSNHNPVVLDEVVLKQEVNNKTIAMYVGRDKNYQKYEGNSFPKGYNLNIEESKCIDNNGVEIDKALQEENGNISLTTNKSSYCYLYFDEKENLSNICNDSTMEDCMSNNKDKITTIENVSNLTSELYRYHGLDVDNYICFGTSDKEQCLSDQDKYLYRIIGINEEGNLKLIKHTSIGEKQWNEKSSQEECGEDGENCNWENSTIKNYLNTNFLTNEEYIPTGWQDKIAEVNWNVGLTKTYSEQPYAEKIYEKERAAQTSKTSKIGLMYMSDHYYAYDNGEGTTDCDSLKCNSWIYRHVHEWTMTFIGFDSWNKAISAGIIYLSQVGSQPLTEIKSFRPVFFLVNTIKVTGLGTIDNPYLIKDV